jgi:hypothetical protein
VSGRRRGTELANPCERPATGRGTRTTVAGTTVGLVGRTPGGPHRSGASRARSPATPVSRRAGAELASTRTGGGVGRTRKGHVAALLFSRGLPELPTSRSPLAWKP